MAKEMNDIGLVAVSGGEDLLISGGDFVVVESTAQHQRQLILNNKGEFKQNPNICVGAVNFIDDEGRGNIIREITMQFIQDGMDVVDMSPNQASVSDSTVKVFLGASYK